MQRRRLKRPRKRPLLPADGSPELASGWGRTARPTLTMKARERNSWAFSFLVPVLQLVGLGFGLFRLVNEGPVLGSLERLLKGDAQGGVVEDLIRLQFAGPFAVADRFRMVAGLPQ